MAVIRWKGPGMTRAAVTKRMKENRKDGSEKPTWLDSVFDKIHNATELYTSYRGLQGDDKGNAIYDIRYDTEKRPVPEHLELFVGIMGDLEQFGTDFCDEYKIFERVIAKQGEHDNAIGTLLDSKTKGNYGDFGVKARAAVLFVRRNRRKLREAGVTGPTSTGQTKRLRLEAGADMSALRDLPPNTPTLVAMQRLLVSLSDGVT